MNTAEIHTVDGAYMIEFGLVPDGLCVKDLSGDTTPHTYHPPYNTYLYYYTGYGVWRRTTGNGKWEFDGDKSGCVRDYRPVIVRKCGIPIEPKVREYSPMMETQYYLKPEYTKEMRKEKGDDMIDAAIYNLSMQTARRQRQGVITDIKEVKKKMTTKSLYHVILFNKKDEVIAFKEIIPAEDAMAAGMLAAQKYGMYDPNEHVTIIKEIDHSDYEPVK